MEDEKDLDKKLAEFDQKVTPQYLLKLQKVKLAERILKGDTGLKKEFDELIELEKSLNTKGNPEAVPAASLPQASSPPGRVDGEDAPPSEEDEIGIPQRLRVKRHYPITDKVIEQRRNAARASRPGSAGNKRNWKGGLHAQDLITGRIKPCLSTCPIFEDCELVNDGATKPGGVCLDKQAVIATYSAIMEAIKGTGPEKYDDFHEVSGLMVAETMHVARMLMEDIMREGSTVKRERYDKNGVLQMVEYVSHPSLMALPKLIADLGLTPRELNITPKAIKDDKNAADSTETIGKVLGSVGEMIAKSRKKTEDKE